MSLFVPVEGSGLIEVENVAPILRTEMTSHDGEAIEGVLTITSEFDLEPVFH